MMTLEPLGDRAFLARFRTEAEASAWASAVRVRAWHGVVDVVLAYQTAAVYADPDQVEIETLEDRLRAIVAPRSGMRPAGNPITLPVLYDGDDLADVADRLKLTVAEVIAQHTGHDFQVFAVGFQPGFPYAGYLPRSLAGVPRLDAPRLKVPAGSVAIAGKQTGVYPSESPGGWRLLGRTPLRIADMETGYFPIRAGDRLRFEAIDRARFEAQHGALL